MGEENASIATLQTRWQRAILETVSGVQVIAGSFARDQQRREQLRILELRGVRGLNCWRDGGSGRLRPNPLPDDRMPSNSPGRPTRHAPWQSDRQSNVDNEQDEGLRARRQTQLRGTASRLQERKDSLGRPFKTGTRVRIPWKCRCVSLEASVATARRTKTRSRNSSPDPPSPD